MAEQANQHICPVCGFPGLEEGAYTEFGESSFEICPCCGIEFGYQDARRSHEQLRTEWISAGMAWRFPERRPGDWDPVLQLRILGHPET